ncbi:hypothetical protein [Jannaschia sp. M317]|uniref:hypothetical protein n=1 Tax=Jannaschia sp. M317 TaxID=2867011 RepID=UPI0021A3B2E5|nr:hypothetical protein [Jannaschia sp. M317]
MIRYLLNMGIRKFAKRYGYDASYMSHVVQTSSAAGVRLSLLPLYSQFRGPKEVRDVWAGAMLGSTLDGDCGPCVQLVIDMALEVQVSPDQLALCLQGDAAAAGDVGLGFRFAQAAIDDSPDLENLRAEIETRFGPVAVTTASIAASSGRIYPVLKRGLGFGQACSIVQVGHEKIQADRTHKDA